MYREGKIPLCFSAGPLSCSLRTGWKRFETAGRNDEGLTYAKEALQIAEVLGDAEHEAEACYVIGSLLINKNRWSDPVDPEIYRTAGEWLDRGQAIADKHGIERLRRNGILFRSRWLQQGGRNEAIIPLCPKLKSRVCLPNLTRSLKNKWLVPRLILPVN